GCSERSCPAKSRPRRPRRTVRLVDQAVVGAGVQRAVRDRGRRGAGGVVAVEQVVGEPCRHSGTSVITRLSSSSHTSSGTPPTVVVSGTSAVVPPGGGTGGGPGTYLPSSGSHVGTSPATGSVVVSKSSREPVLRPVISRGSM